MLSLGYPSQLWTAHIPNKTQILIHFIWNRNIFMIQQHHLEMFRYMTRNDVKFSNKSEKNYSSRPFREKKKQTTKNNFIPNNNSFWFNLANIG